MPEKMKAIRKVRPEKGLVIEDIPLPKVGSHDVLVRVEAASICGTDLHIWEWNEWSQRRLKLPLTIGHEFSGTVVEVGGEGRDRQGGRFRLRRIARHLRPVLLLPHRPGAHVPGDAHPGRGP